MTRPELLTALDAELRYTALAPLLKQRVRDILVKALDRIEEPAEASPSAETIESIIDDMAAATGISAKKMRGRRRTDDVATARMLVMYIVRMQYGNVYSVTKTGRLFNRHHSTVIHAVRTIGEDLQDSMSRASVYYSLYKKYCDEHRNIR
jgi:chromosomal replication initiation ATPase DnaA